MESQRVRHNRATFTDFQHQTCPQLSIIAALVQLLIISGAISNCPLLFPSSSAGKESAYKVRDPSSIPGLGRSPGEGIGLPTPVSLGFSGGSVGKDSARNVGDPSSIPGLGRSPREGNGNSFQYFSQTEEPGGLQCMGSQSVGHD